MTIGAGDLESRGYVLAAKIAREGGSVTATVFAANTPVAIVLIVAGAAVIGTGMLTQQRRRLQEPELALTEGGGDRPRL
jgi:hypothetical protein